MSLKKTTNHERCVEKNSEETQQPTEEEKKDELARDRIKQKQQKKKENKAFRFTHTHTVQIANDFRNKCIVHIQFLRHKDNANIGCKLNFVNYLRIFSYVCAREICLTFYAFRSQKNRTNDGGKNMKTKADIPHFVSMRQLSTPFSVTVNTFEDHKSITIPNCVHWICGINNKNNGQLSTLPRNDKPP